MSMIPERLYSYLDEHKIDYQIVPDPTEGHGDGLGQEGTSVITWVLAIGESYVLMVLPTDQGLAVGPLSEAHKGQRARLASEAEIQHLFPDCDPTAIPPVGPPYGVPVYVSHALASSDAIVCASGKRGTRLRIDWWAFEALVRPRWLRLPVTGPLALP